uniref:Uncharacterized protein n=1 Tax=Romanomermis culicivorax TaxID=13658 RepID=A0A915IQ35_ROMCU
MMDKFRSEQLIDDNVYTVMRDSLEEVTNFDKRIASSRGQYMITGNIFVVDTTIAQHDPKSISWSYTFCKVKVKGLTSQEQNGEHHEHFLPNLSV